MDKFLDFLHQNKGFAAVALFFLGGGLKAIGQEKYGDAVWGLGTLLKFGFLPDGPNPKTAEEK